MSDWEDRREEAKQLDAEDRARRRGCYPQDCDEDCPGPQPRKLGWLWRAWCWVYDICPWCEQTFPYHTVKCEGNYNG